MAQVPLEQLFSARRRAWLLATVLATTALFTYSSFNRLKELTDASEERAGQQSFLALAERNVLNHLPQRAGGTCGPAGGRRGRWAAAVALRCFVQPALIPEVAAMSHNRVLSAGLRNDLPGAARGAQQAVLGAGTAKAGAAAARASSSGGSGAGAGGAAAAAGGGESTPARQRRRQQGPDDGSAARGEIGKGKLSSNGKCRMVKNTE